ncbi:type II toxin-antitoxin system Phd/YefM family antitoxin [Leptolyngbya sp. FACHB-17]|uniref:type II toxin-antitoxin system Phd/YefM family antitoxin n=1 Tax=unclassified Leptolyngbya TaxID=2650499 RepID=UPI0016814B98|nr:type II toxin-antitoxin system Phd/YefM family antitoxin [Leptolyngbya sp. FACHB-17]MBD2080381.1 type II toxin-antitoxin system Phd/YefM family antitoxin [Leptolyngbya sp. FACHB-17]
MTITTNDLPEALQAILLKLQRTNTPLTVIHEGKPIAIINPAQSHKPRPAAGFMKGRDEILGDIVSPIEQPWEVLQ